jgi:hypothetical protein
MKLTNVVLLALGYVIGAKAGRERYQQIVSGVARASQRLEAFSTHRPARRQEPSSSRADSGS